jgi:hypothetical protein
MYSHMIYMQLLLSPAVGMVHFGGAYKYSTLHRFGTLDYSMSMIWALNLLASINAFYSPKPAQVNISTTNYKVTNEGVLKHYRL